MTANPTSESTSRRHGAPVKSPSAQQALAQRNALPAALRMLLIVVDGQRTGTQLIEIANALGLGGLALNDLQSRGLIEWPAASPLSASRVSTQEAKVERDVTKGEPLPVAPTVSATTPIALAKVADNPDPGPSTPSNAEPDVRTDDFRLMQTKMYALDLAGRMLAGRDRALRASARLVECEETLEAWLQDCSHVIADVGGAERAAFFLQRVGEVRR